jgi:hypothetical protein
MCFLIVFHIQRGNCIDVMKNDITENQAAAASYLQLIAQRKAEIFAKELRSVAKAESLVTLTCVTWALSFPLLAALYYAGLMESSSLLAGIVFLLSALGVVFLGAMAVMITLIFSELVIEPIKTLFS